MNIYFAGSIRGGREDQLIYQKIIDLLQKFGTVLSEHFGNASISSAHGTGNDVERIYQQDMKWVEEADVIIAEVTQPSLGVGYELGRAEAMGKHILCLYRPSAGKSLSAMIAGNSKLMVKEYQTIEDVSSILTEFFNQL